MKIEPMQALQILSEASAKALLSRADHEAVIHAVAVMKALVELALEGDEE